MCLGFEYKQYWFLGKEGHRSTTFPYGCLGLADNRSLREDLTSLSNRNRVKNRFPNRFLNRIPTCFPDRFEIGSGGSKSVRTDRFPIDSQIDSGFEISSTSVQVSSQIDSQNGSQRVLSQGGGNAADELSEGPWIPMQATIADTLGSPAQITQKPLAF